jgi:hypothetical protein
MLRSGATLQVQPANSFYAKYHLNDAHSALGANPHPRRSELENHLTWGATGPVGS